MQQTRRSLSRRDLLLQQMGISQWALARPEALKGVMNIAVSEHIRLIIVSEQNLLRQTLVQDLLRALQLDDGQILNITFAQLPYLQVKHAASYWLLDKNAEEIHRTLSHLPQPLNLWQTPALAELKTDPQAKRQFWQQIQQSAPIQ